MYPTLDSPSLSIAKTRTVQRSAKYRASPLTTSWSKAVSSRIAGSRPEMRASARSRLRTSVASSGASPRGSSSSSRARGSVGRSGTVRSACDDSRSGRVLRGTMLALEVRGSATVRQAAARSVPRRVDQRTPTGEPEPPRRMLQRYDFQRRVRWGGASRRSAVIARRVPKPRTVAFSLRRVGSRAPRRVAASTRQDQAR